MILSMTGYGRKTFELNNKNIVVEVRSLNSKGMDVNVRIPALFREQELDIRNILSRRIVRGKIDFNIIYEQNEEKTGELNATAVKEYYIQLKAIAADLKLDTSNILDMVFRLPNITTMPKEEMLPEQWQIIDEQINEACNQLEQFRKDEGINLEKDLIIRVNNILETLSSVELLGPERITSLKDKLMTDLTNYIAGDQINKNRFEEEVIYYLEKMDITEEVIRLRSHCNYFLQTLNDMSTEKGKKLGFITQEMGREINTIGSKSYHAEMQKQVVIMKDELEKMKEQLNNVL
jgi:uncharacterized protein (TIGR00255 family)